MSAAVARPATRLVRSTTYRSRSGSIQSDVPVNPVWPMARGDRNRPHDEVGSAVSQASARDEPGTGERRAKARIAHDGASAVSSPRRPRNTRRARSPTPRGAAEQAGVPGHATHRGRVVVVHLASQRTAAPRTVSGAGTRASAGTESTERWWHRRSTPASSVVACASRGSPATRSSARPSTMKPRSL